MVARRPSSSPAYPSTKTPLQNAATNAPRFAAARTHLPDFGVAAYCGFGRRKPSELNEILQEHLQAVDVLAPCGHRVGLVEPDRLAEDDPMGASMAEARSGGPCVRLPPKAFSTPSIW